MTGEAGPQSEALAAALKDLTIAKGDGAAVELARRYAALIDEATSASKYRKALEKIGRALDPDDDAAAAAFNEITDALGAHSVASDLGPKYLAALVQLGMTPAARGVKQGEQKGQKGSANDELRRKREERAARAAGAGQHDS